MLLEDVATAGSGPSGGRRPAESGPTSGGVITRRSIGGARANVEQAGLAFDAALHGDTGVTGRPNARQHPLTRVLHPFDGQYCPMALSAPGGRY